MKTDWQEAPLGKVLKRADRFEKKDEMQTYHFAGTYSFARGIFAGEVKEGSTFGLDKIQRIKKGDFIYCKIMAWEGAFGIAPEKVDGCVMSGAFVAYEVDQTQIYPKFLDYYFKQEPVWKSIGSQSTGTNVRRRSLHPDHFEKATIPFPPLDEQRRIVERIEALASRIAKAESLRGEATSEIDLLKIKIIGKVFDELTENKKPLSEVAEKKTGVAYRSDDFSDNPNEGVPVVRLAEIQTKKSKVFLRNPDNYTNVWLQEGDIILAKTSWSTGSMCMWNNTKAVLNQNAIMLRAKKMLDQEYFYYWLGHAVASIMQSHLADSDYYPYIREKDLITWEIPVLPLDEQRRIVAYLDSVQARLASLRELQSATGEELSALLPSVLDRAFKGEL